MASFRSANTKWLNAKLSAKPGTTNYLLECKKEIEKAIWDKRRPNLKRARQVISDFKKICKDEELIFDLMIFYVEKGVEFENEFGDLYEAYYASLESVYIEVTEKLKKNKKLAEKLKPRLKKIIENAADGWGHKDTLGDYFSLLYDEL